MNQKILFINRDGTLIKEPSLDFQANRMDKFALEPGVIPALLSLQKAGFRLVMVTNQNDLGVAKSSQVDFASTHELMMAIFTSQGIIFDDILICQNLPLDFSIFHKMQTGIVIPWLQDGVQDSANSYMVSDRETDMVLAANMGISGLLYQCASFNWPAIADQLTRYDRYANINRITRETAINVEVWLDREGDSQINTGIGFFDHMLNQIATHGGLRMNIMVKGDLHIDDHHTVEDTALALGEALNKALGDKHGIGRFGFMLPVDECLARCVLDISGRPHLEYKAEYSFQRVGDLSTEMIEHFFRSLSHAMACTLHLRVKGKNDHHRVESMFKAFGRTLRQAIRVEGDALPRTKGVL